MFVLLFLFMPLFFNQNSLNILHNNEFTFLIVDSRYIPSFSRLLDSLQHADFRSYTYHIFYSRFMFRSKRKPLLFDKRFIASFFQSLNISILLSSHAPAIQLLHRCLVYDLWLLQNAHVTSVLFLSPMTRTANTTGNYSLPISHHVLCHTCSPVWSLITSQIKSNLLVRLTYLIHK